MRLLRQGGEFADGRIRYHAKTAIWCFLGCVAVVAAFFLIGPQWVGLIGLLAVFLNFGSAYDRWENWFLGKRGELAVTRVLNALPDDYVLLNDLYLREGRGNVDHLLIGPNGLFAIETKNCSGDVKCIGDQWFVNGRRIKSLSRQAKRNGVAIYRSLKPLFSGSRQRQPFVVALLVFVKHRSKLELDQPTVSVLKAEELVEFIRGYSSGPVLQPEIARSIVRHLQTLQSEDTKQRELLEKFSLGLSRHAVLRAANEDRWTL